MLVKLLPHFILKKIEHRPDFVRQIENISWLFVDKALRMGVGLLIGMLMARYLGPEKFGQLNYAQAFVGLFGALSGLGLNSIVVRDIVRDPSCAKETLGTAFVMQFCAGVFSVVMIVLLIWLIRPHDGLMQVMVAVLGFSLLFKSFEVVRYWFESQVQSKYYIYVENLVFLLSAFVKIVFIYKNAPLIYFIIIILLESILIAAGFVIIARYKKANVKYTYATIRKFNDLIRDCWPLVMSGVALMVQARIDQIMLGEMINEAEVGLYCASLRVVEVAGIPSMILQSSLYPLIIKKYNKDKVEYINVIQKYYGLMFYGSIPIMFFLILFSDSIINMLYGLDYEQSIVMLQMMAFRVFFTHMGICRGSYLIAENMIRYSLFTMIAGTVANVVFNLFLIPLYGSSGAIISTIISFFITTFFCDFFNKKARASLIIFKNSVIKIV